MNYPVKVYEIDKAKRGAEPAKPRLMEDFQVVAKTVDHCRRTVEQKLQKKGMTIRSLSFSPDPEPKGSIIVYVFTREEAEKVPAKSSRRRLRK